MIALTSRMAAYTRQRHLREAGRDDALPFGEVMFLRGALSVADPASRSRSRVTGALRQSLAGRDPAGSCWRALFDALGTVCFIAALVHMKIADLVGRGPDRRR